jgi:hypothetical protein
MQIDGEWHLCDDGIVRPIIRGEVESADGPWFHTRFLLDTGADRTVFDADTIAALGAFEAAGTERLGGFAGTTEARLVRTEVRLTRDGAGKVVFRGDYAAVTDPEMLDMSVLGRDITGLFAVIVDQPGGIVCLLGQRHSYLISRTG